MNFILLIKVIKFIKDWLTRIIKAIGFIRFIKEIKFIGLIRFIKEIKFIKDFLNQIKGDTVLSWWNRFFIAGGFLSLSLGLAAYLFYLELKEHAAVAFTVINGIGLFIIRTADRKKEFNDTFFSQRNSRLVDAIKFISQEKEKVKEDDNSDGLNQGLIGFSFSELSELRKSSDFEKRIDRFTSRNDFRKFDLSDLDLSDFDFSDTKLWGTGLQRADLQGADLQRTQLIKANLRGADLSGAVLCYAKLLRADLSGANLSGADLRGADLRGTDLRGADLSGADLIKANLGNTNLSGAYLIKANLINAALRNAKLVGADFSNAELYMTDLRGTDWESAKWDGANLDDAIRCDADLEKFKK